MKSSKLGNFVQYSDEDQGEAQISNVSESIDKLDKLLNDSSSPIMSTIRSTSKYSVNKLPETIEEYRTTVKDGDFIDNPVDLNRIINDYRNIGQT